MKNHRLAHALRWQEDNALLLCTKASNERRHNSKMAMAYIKERVKVDPVFKLTLALRSRLGIAIKAQGTKKAKKTFELLGCTAVELRRHLEAQFKPGMTWRNHGQGRGKWHIDHIKPVAAHDLTQRSEQCACFHFTNLQPMWAVDNQRKGDQWEGRRTRKPMRFAES